MNFYKRHLGDYAKDAGHLTMLEHGAYTLLLDRYYTTEKPIPSSAEAYRVCRARSGIEKAAVDAVLAEFFITDGQAHLNRRAEEEIAKASHQRSVNQELGKRGGRPKKTESVIEQETESEANRNPSQTPDSITPIAPKGAKEQPEIPCPYAQIVALYHEHLPSLPRAKVTTAPRQRGMRSFWGWLLGSTKADGSRRATTADEALQWIAGYFAQAAENDFLMGRTPRSAEHAGWRCDIDFLMTPKGIKQVVERTKDAA